MQIRVFARQIQRPSLAAIRRRHDAADLDANPNALGIILVNNDGPGPARQRRLDRHAPIGGFGNLGKGHNLVPGVATVITAKQTGGLRRRIQCAVTGAPDHPNLIGLHPRQGPAVAAIVRDIQPSSGPREQTLAIFDKITHAAALKHATRIIVLYCKNTLCRTCQNFHHVPLHKISWSRYSLSSLCSYQAVSP